MAELEGVTLFRGLSPQELTEVSEVVQEREFTNFHDTLSGTPHSVRPSLQDCPPQDFSRPAIIFREGDNGDGLYVIKSGSVQIAHVQGGEIRYVFCTMKPGDVFGEWP